MNTFVRNTPGPWTEDEIRRMPTMGLQKFLGIKLLVLEPELVQAEICNRPEFANSTGGIHGGVLMAIADSLGGMGALQHLGPDRRTATIESKTNFVKSASSDVLYASCSSLHIGRRTSVWVTTLSTHEHGVVAVTTQTQLHFC